MACVYKTFRTNFVFYAKLFVNCEIVNCTIIFFHHNLLIHKFQCLLCDFASTCPRKLEEHINRAHFDLTSPSILGNANSNTNSNANSDNPTLGLTNPTITLTNTITLDNKNKTLDNKNKTLASAMALSPGPHGSSFQCPICEREFVSGSDVEMHVNVEHRDILSPQKPVSLS